MKSRHWVIVAAVLIAIFIFLQSTGSFTGPYDEEGPSFMEAMTGKIQGRVIADVSEEEQLALEEELAREEAEGSRSPSGSYGLIEEESSGEDSLTEGEPEPEPETITTTAGELGVGGEHDTKNSDWWTGGKVHISATTRIYKGHSFALTRDWEQIGHNFQQSVDGHEIQVTRGWGDHDYEITRSWENENHELRTTELWEKDGHQFEWTIGNHDTETTEGWAGKGHKYIWTIFNHDTSDTKEWVGLEHSYYTTDFWDQNSHSYIKTKTNWWEEAEFKYGWYAYWKNKQARQKEIERKAGSSGGDSNTASPEPEPENPSGIGSVGGEEGHYTYYSRDNHDTSLSESWKGRHDYWNSIEWWKKYPHDERTTTLWYDNDHKDILSITWRGRYGDHGYVLSREWERIGHNFYQSVDGHEISVTGGWGNHIYPVTKQWENENHNVIKTEEWEEAGHRFRWTIDKHDTNLSKKWWSGGKSPFVHHYLTTREWEKEGHEWELTDEWVANGHTHKWTKDGHDTNRSNAWGRVNHSYRVSAGERNYPSSKKGWGDSAQAGGHDEKLSAERAESEHKLPASPGKPPEGSFEVEKTQEREQEGFFLVRWVRSWFGFGGSEEVEESTEVESRELSAADFERLGSSDFEGKNEFLRDAKLQGNQLGEVSNE